MNNVVSKLHWCRGQKRTNFGDELTSFMFTKSGISHEYCRNPGKADVVGIGSILHSIPENFQGMIWSSGLMHETDKRHFDKALILGVRGRETLTRISFQSNNACPVLGDGGLLLPRFLPSKQPMVTTKFKLGIFPHFYDYHYLLQNSPKLIQHPDVCVIDSRWQVDKIASTIQSCECLVSSALHGLIAADSFRIPNQRIEFPTSIRISGDGFKFKDYYSVFDISDYYAKKWSDDVSLEQLISWTKSYERRNLDYVVEQLQTSFNYLRQRLTMIS